MEITITKFKKGVMGNEGPTWEATVAIDGKDAFTATETGTGGGMILDALGYPKGKIPTKEQTASFRKNQALIDEARRWVQAMPPRPAATADERAVYGETVPADFEVHLEDLANRFDVGRRLARDLAKKIVMVEGGKMYNLTPKAGVDVAKAAAVAATQYPNATILNLVPLERAVELAYALAA